MIDNKGDGLSDGATQSAPPPLMRASHMLQNLESLKKLGESVEADVLKTLRPDTVERIRSELKTAWLPLALDVDLTEGIGKVLGIQGVRDWSCDALMASFEGPLLRPMLDGGLRVFGVNPYRIFGLYPRGMNLVYKNVGKLVVTRTGDSALTMEHHDAPTEMLESLAYVEGMAGAFSSLLSIVRTPGSVTVGAVDPSTRRIDYDVRWTMK